MIAASIAGCTSTGKTSEWIQLFDGKTMNGWKALDRKGNIDTNADIKVVGGIIEIRATSNVWVLNEKKFKDFELVVEALMPEPPYNSGIGFRCTEGSRQLGYQCEIAGQKSGSIYAIGSGWVWPTDDKTGMDAYFKRAGNCYKEGEWNTFKIRCEGSRIQTWVNGKQTVDTIHDVFTEGSVAIQHHGKGDAYKFRKIQIRAL